MSLHYSNLIHANLHVDSIPREVPCRPEPLEIIAQPWYKSKLRYRSDYTSNRNRRGVLHSQTNVNYRHPAICIPRTYLNITEQYYIRVCLVTVENEKTRCRYVHPYILEDMANDEYNDRHHNVVWFPIQQEDSSGIKSFPNLRVVKIKVTDLKNHGAFRVLDSPTDDSTPQLSSTKDTIKEFNLNKAQLAFTIGKKIIGADGISMVSYSSTTIFSDEMIDNVTKDSDLDHVSTDEAQTSESSHCRMYKYAPRHGCSNANEEVLILYKNKLKPKRYGELQVTFECERCDGYWSEPVLGLEVKDQTVSFRTPIFPFPIDNITPVNIVLRQRKRTFESLIFNYVPIIPCPHCRRQAMEFPNLFVETNQNKRLRLDPYSDDETTDSLLSICENDLANRASNSQRDLSSFHTTTELHTSSVLINENASQSVLDILADSVAVLFSKMDFTPLLRICRSFVRKQPHLLHTAVTNNHFALLAKFIPVAQLTLLRHKNQLGESLLLHAARLNRLHVVQTLLDKPNSDELLDDVNDKGQNILHVVVMNIDAAEMLDLLIDHFRKRSIDIEEKFDDVDEDDHTPLELSIVNNNQAATHKLLKYSNNSIRMTSNAISPK